MTAPLEIPFIRDPSYEPGDVVMAEVDGELLADRWPAAAFGRGRSGFGFGEPGAVPFGRLVAVPGDEAFLFGLGRFGAGAAVATLTTRQAFAAGDYVVRLRVGDDLPPAGGGAPAGGNLSDWSAAFVVRHRPTGDQLARPRSLTLDGQTLRWTFA